MSIEITEELRVRIRIRKTPTNASVVEYLSQALKDKQLTQVVVTAVKVLMALENTEMLKKMLVDDPVSTTQLADKNNEYVGVKIAPGEQIKTNKPESVPVQSVQVQKPILEVVEQTQETKVKVSAPEAVEDTKEDGTGGKEGSSGGFKTSLSML
tara:strand:+ start:13 stop:474 length:462 start_codon:yes stop_codon:yes gene_type:complete